MILYKLHFFKKGTGLCADDFNNKEYFENINPEFILSISGILSFNTPLSKRYVGEYAIVTMSNNDKYFIKSGSFIDLQEQIKKY